MSDATFTEETRIENNERIGDLTTALRDCIAAWDRYYPSMPSPAEDDEFGAFLRARDLLKR
jgi:hypothetical protein